MAVADLLIPETVRQYRSAVLTDSIVAIQDLLQQDPKLLHSEFTAERGISQAIHHFASVEVGELLLNSGADLNVLTSLNESPLGLQVRFGDLDRMRLLLKRGADPNLGRVGLMPSDRMPATIELLLEYNWKLDSNNLLHDANHGHGSRVLHWLHYGADPNAKDDQGRTALHLLAARGTGKDAIQSMAEAGADLNARDSDGNRPIDLAQAASRSTAADMLLAIGAEP